MKCLMLLGLKIITIDVRVATQCLTFTSASGSCRAEFRDLLFLLSVFPATYSSPNLPRENHTVSETGVWCTVMLKRHGHAQTSPFLGTCGESTLPGPHHSENNSDVNSHWDITCREGPCFLTRPPASGKRPSNLSVPQSPSQLVVFPANGPAPGREFRLPSRPFLSHLRGEATDFQVKESW